MKMSFVEFFLVFPFSWSNYHLNFKIAEKNSKITECKLACKHSGSTVLAAMYFFQISLDRFVLRGWIRIRIQ